MIAKVFSATTSGLDAIPIEVEADISSGLPAFTIVGLPDKAVEESKERVRAALKNSGVSTPSRRTTINLAPADIKKEGPAFDLPIALGLLLTSKQISISDDISNKTLFIGELSLDGRLRTINGVLPIAIMAKEKGFSNIFLPYENALEASFIPGLNIYPLNSITQLISHLKEEEKIPKFKKKIKIISDELNLHNYDFAYIKGQEHAKRALEIAAAGMHNVLMVGSPGGGKTLLARSFSSILPNMSEEEMLDVSRIYSVAGKLRGKYLVTERPFRNPHHTSSDISLVGGGQHPKPGEITLAHRGVLFLDELPEFGRSVLEVLRQPLEDGAITVSRASGSLEFPASFILVGAMNPCPCGYLNDPEKECICSPATIIRYQKRISGPLKDRVDIHLEIPRVKFDKLTDEKVSESSKEIKKRVEKARELQKRRFKNTKINSNYEMKIPEIKKFCQIDEVSQNILKNAMYQLHLSARAYHRILKIARTIADLESSEKIKSVHIAEALQYRPKEMLY